mgnify:CR=1 FL=1
MQINIWLFKTVQLFIIYIFYIFIIILIYDYLINILFMDFIWGTADILLNTLINIIIATVVIFGCNIVACFYIIAWLYTCTPTPDRIQLWL